jgi:hypothetical protein
MWEWTGCGLGVVGYLCGCGCSSDQGLRTTGRWDWEGLAWCDGTIAFGTIRGFTYTMTVSRLAARFPFRQRSAHAHWQLLLE